MFPHLRRTTGLQVRTPVLYGVSAWSFCAELLSHVQLCATLWTVVQQALLSMGILQARIQEWVAMPSSRDLPNPGIEPRSPTLQVDSLPSGATSICHTSLLSSTEAGQEILQLYCWKGLTWFVVKSRKLHTQGENYSNHGSNHGSKHAYYCTEKQMRHLS